MCSQENSNETLVKTDGFLKYQTKPRQTFRSGKTTLVLKKKSFIVIKAKPDRVSLLLLRGKVNFDLCE